MDQPYSDTNAGLHYDLRAEVDPAAGFISVSGSLAYHAPHNRLERARFYLHRQFEIQRIAGRRVLGYHFEPYAAPESANDPQPFAFMPQAGILDIYFDPPLRRNETALIQFEYQGTLTEWPADSRNVITPDWAELGMYLPWFPLQYSGGEPSILTFTLKASAPAGYQVSSLGSPTFQDGAYFFTWPHPITDIVLVAGRALETRLLSSAPNYIYLNYAGFGEPAALALGEDMLWALERFSGWFGPTRPAGFTLIESPRALGGGYARRGLVVLGGVNEQDYLDQREAYLRYLGHEVAHTWWWQARRDTWEDWLNESFAEYSALLVLRERFGQENFERLLERKRDRSPDILPLWGFEREDHSTPEKQAVMERMLYDKGPLLLDGLARRIGYARFLAFCRAMLWSGVIDTTHMLDLLEEIEDAGTRAWMEEKLKTP
jgi:hypothetical protein